MARLLRELGEPEAADDIENAIRGGTSSGEILTGLRFAYDGLIARARQMIFDAQKDC